MFFLIDENLPASAAEPFKAKGFPARCVYDMPELRGQADEVIFDYAVKQEAIVVSRDLGFAHYLRFDLRKVKGVVLLRFPNEISMAAIYGEIARLINDLTERDFCNLLVLEPGALRKREI